MNLAEKKCKNIEILLEDLLEPDARLVKRK